MTNENTTLRDQLASALETAETAAPVTQPTEQIQQTAEETQAAEQRARDEQGRFAKAEEKQEATQEVQKIEQPKPVRPSTWKKDYWEKFDKLDPDIQAYIHQRENEFKSGVSTYKTEADRAKELNEAIAPFLPTIQQNNMQPAQWIKNLGAAHQTLVYGSPQQKVQMFQQLMRDYQIQPEWLGQQQQQDPNMQWLAQQVTGLSSELNSFKSAQQEQSLKQMQEMIDAFSADPANSHFEQVKGTMARILQAGLAPNLKSAYDKAIRMHDEIWTEEQAKRLAADQAEKARQATEAAAKAKSHAVSTKSSSPSNTSRASDKKGLRDVLSEQLDSLGSRV